MKVVLHKNRKTMRSSLISTSVLWSCFLFLKSSVFADFFPITATQSGDYNQANQPTYAGLAIDGDPSTCAFAAENRVSIRNSTYGWLQVDLGNPFLVISVTLTSPSGGDSQYLQNFVVLVSKTNTTDVQTSTTCYTFNTGSEVGVGSQITLTCNPKPLIGRYVTIKRQGGFRQDAISLCEVSITHQPSEGFIYLYNLPTDQIGAYNGQISSLAVDLDAQTCAQPVAAEGSQGWWSIDLQSVYTISEIIIYNSNIQSGSSGYANEFEVRVGSTSDRSSQTLCYNFTSSIPAGGNVTLDCYQPLIGQYLSITRWSPDNTKTIYLCEVYIKGQLYSGPASTTTATTTTTTTVTSTTISTRVSSISSSTTSSTSTSTSLSTSTTSSASTPSASTPSASTPSESTPSASTSSTQLSQFASATSESSTNPSSSPSDSSSNFSSDASGSPPTSLEKREIIIICVVVIIGGCLILAGIGVALFFVIKKYRSREDIETIEKIGLKSGKSKTPPPVRPPTPPPKPDTMTLKMASQPIAADQIVSYVEAKKTSTDAFKNEFKKLPEENKDAAKIGKRAEYSGKNRFKNILPYDHTIVMLKADADEDPSSASTYINANYITGYRNAEKTYIATQGPMSSTLADFWRMIWQENVDIVVMATRLQEAGKRKCEQYWPTKVNETKTFGRISVTLKREETRVSHVYREMTVHLEAKAGGYQDPPRTVRQMHFLQWEDKQKPEHYLHVLNFRKRVRRLLRDTSGPVVVHCSAGVGRTGTYIALDILMEQLKHDNQVSFFKCVQMLRQQRMTMVQNWQQYSFLHEAIASESQTGDTTIPSAAFDATYAQLLQPTTNGSKLEQQFDLLKRFHEVTTERDSAGVQPPNIQKNRNPNIVAYEDARPFLEVTHKESDYINAVYVDGYRSKESFVLTQLPLKDTIVDFWRLIWDHKVKTVVLLNEIDSNDESCPKFLPEENETESFGPFEVKLDSVTEKFPSVLQREFSLSKTNQTNVEALTVLQYKAEDWPKEASVPSSPSSLLNLIDLILANSKSSKSTTVIQCTDGAARSGLFATALYLIDMLNEEQVVDVFQSCRVVALNRPQIIQSQEQYSFLHDLASAKINSDMSPSTNQGGTIYANASAM